jgi:phage baseplate assembly protein gpV
MIRRGVVTDVNDPKNLGRIRARIFPMDDTRHNETPWVWPCSLLAGPGYGLFCLPQIGDEVWLTRADGGDWIWLGYSWRGMEKPSDGSATKRVFRTPAGHQISFDEGGDVEIKNATGSSLILTADGGIRLGEGGKKLLTEDFLSQYNIHFHKAGSVSTTSPLVPIEATPPYVTTQTEAL